MRIGSKVTRGYLSYLRCRGVQSSIYNIRICRAKSAAMLKAIEERIAECTVRTINEVVMLAIRWR